MATVIDVNGFDDYQSTAAKHNDKTIFALFTGSVGENGESWCPDCVDAHPVIEKNVTNLPDGAILIRCSVGDRTFWKDQKNVFRTNPDLRLKCVPTLMKVGKPQRLEEGQCADADLVEMLFTGQ